MQVKQKYFVFYKSYFFSFKFAVTAFVLLYDLALSFDFAFVWPSNNLITHNC